MLRTWSRTIVATSTTYDLGNKTSKDGTVTNELDEIQRLQHHDLAAAQVRAKVWLKAALGIDASSVTLRPQPTSLNSFNGIAVIDGEEVFFKSHTEPGSIIKEYYNSQVMHDVGYNAVLPLRTEQREGQQIAFYPVIKHPVMFDLMRRAERGEASSVTADQLIAAEERECASLLEIYRKSAERSSAADHASAPVHQLFWHRLTGGRYDSFYGDSSIETPGGQPVAMTEILDATWEINGIAQPRTLRELVDEATTVLDPHQAALTVVGHGDAHFGNVFLADGKDFLYFDPAFAGRHSVILDVVKPLFHNVFAQWMYFPEEKAAEVPLQVERSDGRITVSYENAFTPLRKAFLELKRKALIEPLLDWLRAEDALPHGTRTLDLALMCCPLLTMNLTDKKKFPASISWLGLALALQMGNGDAGQEFRFP